MSQHAAPVVDAVVVSYNSRASLRACVEPLTRMPDVGVTVVDNVSQDDSPATVADLPLTVIRSPRNGGFGYGCNLGAAAGSAPYILLLNPDARLEEPALRRLVAVLASEPAVALVGPRILDDEGALQLTQRNFPRTRSTWAQALFLHRVLRRARWTDEMLWDPALYERRGTPEWVSGACMLVRREAFEAVGGFDERFFLYCEDVDLCHALWDRGHQVAYEPGAVVRHTGGLSAPRTTTLPIYARSRLLYARKHYPRAAVPLERLGVAVGELTHALTSMARTGNTDGHGAALRATLTPASSEGRG